MKQRRSARAVNIKLGKKQMLRFIHEGLASKQTTSEVGNPRITGPWRDPQIQTV
jgi:hypothetical protein